MVTTTTPNPDDTPPNGQQERQLYPDPGTNDPLRLILTTDELARECAKRPGQLFVVTLDFSDWGDERHVEHAYLEFADGTRIEVMTA